MKNIVREFDGIRQEFDCHYGCKKGGKGRLRDLPIDGDHVGGIMIDILCEEHLADLSELNRMEQESNKIAQEAMEH